MSSYNNHWSSAKESNNQINKLDEKHIYMIVDVQKLQTSFGKKYVLMIQIIDIGLITKLMNLSKHTKISSDSN